MKKLFCLLSMLALIIGCTERQGTIRIEIFDSPPPKNVQHIYLTVTEVSIHSAENGWEILVNSAATYDVLELVNGVTAL